MTWKMNDKEFTAVQALPPKDRYKYFIKKVADWREIWGLKHQSGWVVACDDQGHELIPVWPHPRFAAACASDEWAGSEAAAISLSDWMEKWLPGMARDKRQVSVFPSPETKGVVVSSEVLESHLREELAENYGE